ncbi:hypothetical protein, unlikely [Trypanosoma brucei brucei TREU927]|uniref:Uncharacterized protein n=2 Tax=Trypanosoma brucei TaxID=5691 RepID=Q38EQ8_TRYB2|nr:hypothetical protein, unlikely [Trypanosoma brucei brucei TREU927]EAN76712.1 hypothetical protein, unlikely [Trypanosoma brucei brucei TREU927]
MKKHRSPHRVSDSPRRQVRSPDTIYVVEAVRKMGKFTVDSSDQRT